MIRAQVSEWNYLPLDHPGPNSFDRAAANKILKVAASIRIGGEDGARILTDHHSKLRAQQVVGIIASDDVVLEILPKIDGVTGEGAVRRRLVQMLACVLDLDVADDRMTELGTQNENLLEILIRRFCDLLFAQVHRGLPRRYLQEENDLAVLRGRLDVTRQFTVLAASPQRLACRYDELSPDIALNRIMKAAVRRLRAVSRFQANQRRLAELALAFADVSDVPVRLLAWDEVVLDRTNRAWGQLLALARLLLGDRFQTTTSGGTTGFALLFEMNTLFEEYIGRRLASALAGSDYKVRLQGPRDFALLEEDGVTNRFAMKPDIVISRGDRRVLVIDTKWKRLKNVLDDAKHGVGQADVYQMMAYAHVYQCERLMLLYPHSADLHCPPGHVARRSVRGTADTRLSCATVSLAEPRSIIAQLRSLLQSEGIEPAPASAAA